MMSRLHEKKITSIAKPRRKLGKLLDVPRKNNALVLGFLQDGKNAVPCFFAWNIDVKIAVTGLLLFDLGELSDGPKQIGKPTHVIHVGMGDENIRNAKQIKSHEMGGVVSVFKGLGARAASKN